MNPRKKECYRDLRYLCGQQIEPQSSERFGYSALSSFQTMPIFVLPWAHVYKEMGK